MRNIVLSDTGGWLPQLLNTFDMLGIDAEASTMPKDLRVLHLGDLIHKGPYSSQLLAIATNLMVANPGQWIQLMGNHEAQHIPGSPRFWQCDCGPQEVGLLNVLHDEGLMVPTYGLRDGALFQPPSQLGLEAKPTSMFFSHGGLTRGFWRWKAAGATDPVEAARFLNELPLAEVTAPGLMLGENVLPSKVGPVWAVGNTEVFQSWQEHEEEHMPFTQWHGHTTSFQFDHNRWWPGLEVFRETAVLLPKNRVVASTLNNNAMLGVDPGFGLREPAINYQTWFEFETLA